MCLAGKSVMAMITRRRERKREKIIYRKQFKTFYNSRRKSDKVFKTDEISAALLVKSTDLPGNNCKDDDKIAVPQMKSTGIPNNNFKDDSSKDENPASIKEENSVLRAKLEASDSKVAGLQDQVKSLIECNSGQESVA